MIIDEARWTRAILSFLIAMLCGQTVFAIQTRSIDGSGNNLGDSTWGQAGTNLRRLATPPAYDDGVDDLRVGPNPRDMSNKVFQQNTSIPDENNLSQFNWAWGQFLAHDTDLTPLQSGGETANITIPAGDTKWAIGPTHINPD